MNTRVFQMLCVMVLLLSAYTSQTATASSPPQTVTPAPPAAAATSESSLVEDAPQTRATTTKVEVGLILGNLLILSLYAFPMSFAISWAFGDPRKTKKRPKKESTESLETTETTGEPAQTIGEETPASIDDGTTSFERLPHWAQKLPRAAVGLGAGGCLMAVVVVVGAAAFALYYFFSGQPEQVSQIIPRFAYWFPFALLGMVTESPFHVFAWEDRRLRVLLRLIVFWLPRLVIIAFVINPPLLQDLDPATTALAVLVIDGVIVTFFLLLHTLREQTRMKGIH